MREVTDASELFRVIDGTNLDDDSYTFKVDDDITDKTTLVGEGNPNNRSIRELKVSFDDMSGDGDLHEAALEELMDTDFTGEEDYVDVDMKLDVDGKKLFANSTRLGYFVKRSEEPLRGAFVVIFPDMAYWGE